MNTFLTALSTITFILFTGFITGMIGLFREVDENPRFVHDLQSMKNSR